MTDTSEGAAIYYTTSALGVGVPTAPTTASTLYSGPITVTAPTTFAAVAAVTSASGAVYSGVVDVTINVVPLAPTVLPDGGVYVGSTTVNLTNRTYTTNLGVPPVANICYTTDGSTRSPAQLVARMARFTARRSYSAR